MTSQPVILGGLYWVKDNELSLPPNEDRAIHESRVVLVVSGPDTNSDPAWPFILVAPVSSETTRKTKFCVKLAAGEGNAVRKCWVRVPALQPLLKDQLGDHLGVIPAQKLIEAQARLFQYLGLADDDGFGE